MTIRFLSAAEAELGAAARHYEQQVSVWVRNSSTRSRQQQAELGLFLRLGRPFRAHLDGADYIAFRTALCMRFAPLRSSSPRSCICTGTPITGRRTFDGLTTAPQLIVRATNPPL